MKRQPMDWDKIFANNTINNSLMSKIRKQLIQLNNEKPSNPIKAWAEGLHRHFSKDIQGVDKHMKWCSPLLIIREIETKTTVRYHLTLVSLPVWSKVLEQQPTASRGWPAERGGRFFKEVVEVVVVWWDYQL